MIASEARIGRWRVQASRGLLWGLAAALGAGAVFVGHLRALSLPANEAHPVVIASHLYALLLLAGLLLLMAGVGRAALRFLNLPSHGRLEGWLFASAIGAGIVAYVVLAIGLAGFLRPSVLAIAILALACLCRHDLLEAARAVPALLRAGNMARRALAGEDRVLHAALILAGVLLLLVLPEALAPPSGYDALMYHLHGPRRFLEIGQIVVLPDVQQANMPFTIDMLYLLGLAFGSDELANVLHMSFCLLVVASIFAFAREFIGERVAWIASIVFLSTLMIFVFAPMANVDYGMTLFDFLSVYAVVRWLRDRNPRWLIVAGMLSGFAVGTKYIGAITAGMLGLFVLVMALRTGQTWRERIQLVLMFGVSAALIAAPWYVKNWLWLGSPIWPFLAPGATPFNIVISPNTNYGRGFWDILYLPVQIFVHGSLEYPGARPPVLLLLLPLYLIVRKHRLVTMLLGLAAVQIVVWTQGAHVLRYLTAALPELCIGAAYVADQLGRRPGWGARGPLYISAIVAFGIFIPVLTTVRIEAELSPFPQLVGLESRQSYLSQLLPNHELVAYLNEQGDDVRGVLLVGDRRAFYVNAPTWVDVSLGAFETLAMAPTADDARTYLAEIGVSHVLVSEPDLAWHTNFDPEGHIHTWWTRFSQNRSEYLVAEAVYYDLTVYRVVDASEATVAARQPVDLAR